MPIKLLHHKSWHVYSRDNIARVQRDEAVERARLEEQDAALKASSSQARLDVMRGTDCTLHTDVLAKDKGQDTRGEKTEDLKRKRKRGDEMKILDRKLSGHGIDSTSLPVSDYIVTTQTKPDTTMSAKTTRDADNQTFSALAKPVWYAQDKLTDSSEIKRKKASARDQLDPLNEMNAFLARKRAMKQERIAQARHKGAEETYVADRYHKVPEKWQSRKLDRDAEQDDRRREYVSHEREGRHRRRDKLSRVS